MFGQKSKLSKSTRDLVERMAKQSGLSRDQMKRLGKLHSAAPKIGHSNKSRQNGARGSRTVPGRLKLKSRPGRKTQRDIAAQMKQEIYVDPAKLAETDALAIEMSRRRAKSKHRLQHSYLTGLRIGGLDGQIGVCPPSHLNCMFVSCEGTLQKYDHNNPFNCAQQTCSECRHMLCRRFKNRATRQAL